MTIFQTIKQSLEKASGVKTPMTKSVILLEFSSRADFGDLSSSIALKSGSPREVALEIVTKLNKDKGLKDIVEKVDIAGPGFINFHLSKKALTNNLSQILEKKNKYGHSTPKNKKKVVFEFTDPNPFKEFHIGHLYTNIVGETLSRLFAATGWEVHRVNYQGDVGLHVAKAVWGMFKNFKDEKVSLKDLEKKNLREKVKFMGASYALGAKAYEEDENVKQEIKNLNKKIFENSDEIKEVYQIGRKWSLEYFETIYKRLGTKFDNYYFESTVGPIGKKLVEDNIENGVFEKSQGAIIFPGKKYNLHDRVFINSLGLPTYEAKELGLAPTKYKDFQYDLSIIITANEINEYFKVLIKAISLVFPDLGQKTMHIGHGLVKLPEGKMSSRTGNIIAGAALLDTVKEKASEINKDSAEVVSLGAVKYAFLKVGIGKDIIYNIGESLSLEGNSGPYLQYTYARTQSVLNKSTKKPKVSDIDLNAEESLVARQLIKFPEIIQQSAISFAPNILCEYLYSLASSYNTYYNKVKIIGSKNEEFGLALTAATGQVLKNGLTLLGIATPEKM